MNILHCKHFVNRVEIKAEKEGNDMYKNINIRFNLEKEEHRKAWNYMQTMDKQKEKSYSKVIIKALLRYFEQNEHKAGDCEDVYVENSLKKLIKATVEEVMQGYCLASPYMENISNSVELQNEVEPELDDTVLSLMEDMW